jgi:nitrogenase iron protein NifH
MDKMERLVFFGKGGIGKSTTSTNVSATLAGMGRRVLHVGCDPKHDSTVALLDGRMIEAVVDKPINLDAVRPEDIVDRSRLGIDCVEAGGPSAGVGCGGRGISRMLEIFNAAKLLDSGRYDTCIFDILGDVVCGGFASPLKKDFGEKVVIVASEEVMALYAANNIAKAVVNYSSNGVVLAGIILNLRDNREDREPAYRFAKLLGTQIIGFVPRDPLIREAEYRRMTVVEHAPASSIAGVYREIADKIIAIDPKGLPLPTPLTDFQFYEYTRHKFAEPPGGIGRDPHAEAEAKRDQMMRATNGSGLVTLKNGSPRAAAAAMEREEKDEAEFERELRAGRQAVRLGKVRAEEAVRRLKAAFPAQACTLTPMELGL